MAKRYGILAAGLVLTTAPMALATQEFATFPAPAARHDVTLVTVAEGLDTPWGMAFLPDGRILVTERTGKLRTVQEGKLLPEPVAGLPAIEEVGQGGLLGIAVHPDYAQNRLIYVAFAEADPEGRGHRTAIARFQDGNGKAENFEVIYRGATVRSRHHFGCRIVFNGDGTLFFSIGDRGEQDRAQDIKDPTGKVLRINDDGSIPKDNPFVGKDGVAPEVFSFGNRNPQGMTKQPGTGLLWATEHGPQGGDEVNIIRAGVNYGWPVITYGRTYGLGLQIGEGTEKEGLAQPELYFVPSLALSNIAFYAGDKLPAWDGDLVVGLLAGGIARLDMEGGKVVAAERLLENELYRTRDVALGPDGHLYALLEDTAPAGKLVRIERK